MNINQTLNELQDYYNDHAKSYQPVAYINGMKFTKLQLVELLSILDLQSTTDRETSANIQQNDLFYSVDDQGDVYLANKYLLKTHGDTLRAFTEGKGMNPRQFSKVVDMTPASVYNLFSSKISVRPDTAEKILNALDLNFR